MGCIKTIFYGFRSQFMDWISDFSVVIPKENKKVESLLSKAASCVNFMPKWQKLRSYNSSMNF